MLYQLVLIFLLFQAWVVLPQSNDFDNIKMDGKLTTTSSSDISRSVNVGKAQIRINSEYKTNTKISILYL